MTVPDVGNGLDLCGANKGVEVTDGGGRGRDTTTQGDDDRDAGKRLHDNQTIQKKQKG